MQHTHYLIVGASHAALSALHAIRLHDAEQEVTLLTRDDSQRSHVYAPAQAQELLRTGLLLDLIHKAFAGSGKDLVMAALRDGHVTSTEREEIRKLLLKEDQ